MKITNSINHISGFRYLSILKNALEFFISKFLNKKVLCVLLVTVMFVNGFVPRSQEVRNNFFMVISCAVHTAVFEVFSECAETVAAMSNKIAKELFELLMVNTGSTKPKDEKTSDEQPGFPINTSADSGIVSEKNFSEQSQFSILKTAVLYVSYIAVNDLFRLYNNVKIYDNSENIAALFMLLILLFSIYTTRIKDVINNILKIKYVIEPACI